MASMEEYSEFFGLFFKIKLLFKNKIQEINPVNFFFKIRILFSRVSLIDMTYE
jgi:hypothetical protein